MFSDKKIVLLPFSGCESLVFWYSTFFSTQPWSLCKYLCVAYYRIPVTRNLESNVLESVPQSDATNQRKYKCVQVYTCKSSHSSAPSPPPRIRTSLSYEKKDTFERSFTRKSENKILFRVRISWGLISTR